MSGVEDLIVPPSQDEINEEKARLIAEETKKWGQKFKSAPPHIQQLFKEKTNGELELASDFANEYFTTTASSNLWKRRSGDYKPTEDEVEDAKKSLPKSSVGPLNITYVVNITIVKHFESPKAPWYKRAWGYTSSFFGWSGSKVKTFLIMLKNTAASVLTSVWDWCAKFMAWTENFVAGLYNTVVEFAKRAAIATFKKFKTFCLFMVRKAMMNGIGKEMTDAFFSSLKILIQQLARASLETVESESSGASPLLRFLTPTVRMMTPGFKMVMSAASRASESLTCDSNNEDEEEACSYSDKKYDDNFWMEGLEEFFDICGY